MKLLERIFNSDDPPVRVGSALFFERPTWRVTCALKRQETFGQVSFQAGYEVAAFTEEEARKSVRSFVRRTMPECSIESVRAVRQDGC